MKKITVPTGDRCPPWMMRGTRLPRRMASGKALFTSVKVRSRDGSFQFAEKTVMSVVRGAALNAASSCVAARMMPGRVRSFSR